MEVHDGMTLEERDRMLAIEAQDKELAKMLQERVSCCKVLNDFILVYKYIVLHILISVGQSSIFEKCIS